MSLTHLVSKMYRWSLGMDKYIHLTLYNALSMLGFNHVGGSFNTLRPRQNGQNFPDDIFKCIFVNENVWLSIKISLKFVPGGQINNIPSLVQIMAWRRPSDKPLSEPMMVRLLTHICVTRPQCVNLFMATTGDVWIIPCFRIWGYVLYVEHISSVITNCGQHPWAIPFLFSIALEALLEENITRKLLLLS